MFRTLLTIVVATLVIPWTPASAQYAGARGSITVKNATNRWAAVVIEVTSKGSSHWVRHASFCVKNGESVQTWSHMDLFRVRAELRKLGDCRTPNVIATVESQSQQLVMPAGGGLFSHPGAKSGWIQHHVVTIEGKDYTFSIRISSHQ